MRASASRFSIELAALVLLNFPRVPLYESAAETSASLEPGSFKIFLMTRFSSLSIRAQARVGAGRV